MKKISVGMTTYNSSKYVEEQLFSVINQTVKPDEIVIFDDASMDDTVKKIKRIKEQSDIKIELFVNEKNVGFVKNFEQCFKACRGDIIISCDADDIWYPQKVETIQTVFEDDKVVYAYHDVKVINGNGEILLESLNSTWDHICAKENKEEIILRNLRKQGFPYGMTIAFTKELLDEILPFWWGYDEWINLCAPLFGEVRVIEQCLGYYRRHNNNTSESSITKKNKIQAVIDKMKNTKDRWFGFSKLQLTAYQAYLDKFGDKLNDRIKEELRNQIEFLENVGMVLEENKGKAMLILLHLYKKGVFQKYRGNRNTLILDCVYLLLKG